MRVQRPLGIGMTLIGAVVLGSLTYGTAAAGRPHTAQRPVPPRTEIPMKGQLKHPFLCTAMSQCPCFACRNKRSGYSQSIASYAIPSRNNLQTGYYVGGGAMMFGQMRYCNEGTWGSDYQGWICRCIKLKWSHGKRYQGGTGSYRTDGPRLLRPH